MADYNVQMKQYNGTSFDNILPYASQALTLAGGGGATEIIAQARAGLSQIATGSYVGTGTYGQSHPTVINCGFKPKMVFIFAANGSLFRNEYVSVNGGSFVYESTGITVPTANGMGGDNGAKQEQVLSTGYGSPYCLVDDGRGIIVFDGNIGSGQLAHKTTCIVNKDFTSNGVSFYVNSYAISPTRPSSDGVDGRAARYQFNVSSITYSYTAIG